VLLVKDDPEAVEADLAAGRVSCPDCGGRLARWGFGSERQLRTLGGTRRLRLAGHCVSAVAPLISWSRPGPWCAIVTPPR
jgi:hypothetical protein